ncbi:ATPase, T2SS/T4P/T4SS family, partial [Aquabacterium sp. A7-Y]|uniref:ATPase, T2SS/T4P/T4SS family n=1 Tax=Aquabacterium sp. A7-Y TaxID=1349605 RepID=UPI00223D8239
MLWVKELGNQWQPDFARLRYSDARRLGMAAALGPDGPCLLVSDPYAVDAVQHVQSLGSLLPEALVSLDQLTDWLGRFEDVAVSLSISETQRGESERQDPSGQRSLEDISAESLESAASPVVRLINATLYDALKTGASDIHLETTPAGLVVKFRLDGVLRAIREVPEPQTAEQAISRIKVMSELDIAERRVPQDGRLQVQVQGRAIDVRVSIM